MTKMGLSNEYKCFIYNSVNIIHHASRLKEKNYYLIRYIKIICLKNQHLFMINHFSSLGIETKQCNKVYLLKVNC